MNDIVSLVLGAIQGLTEFIPVSSSGHLVIAEHFFGMADHTFLAFVNVGTLVALLVYYRHRLVAITRDVIVARNMTLLRNILLTSIPAGLVGLVLSDFIDHSSFFTSIFVVLTTLTVVGVLMVVLEKLPKASAVEDGGHLSWQRALIVGIAQMFALIPGVSRSGSTIITGRLLGLRPAQAADYSFLASIPIMLAVTLKLLVSSSDRAYFFAHMPAVLISNLAAFVVGLIAIRFLLAYLKDHSLKVFGWYRIGLVGLVVVLLVVRAVLL
jgi:undecaprenyl-diphosphatase